ncbi:MAG: methylenetetrahydrofolate--tRNA-(uracil(54)-C(5))-methyltransferase (FADH(2)-oxidizing) TrmFO [Vicinamibacterales bacterium]
MREATVEIVGGGLAGSEAAWQVASRGIPVLLREMRPSRMTAAHRTDRLAELVCSNSFRADSIENAVGLLKREMRELGSLIMRAADQARVPAGAALAVDRGAFAGLVTGALERHPLVTIVREEVAEIPLERPPSKPVIVATGPLTSESMFASITRLVGEDHLYFYDAVSPIVLAETIDTSIAFRQSRWQGGRAAAGASEAGPTGASCGDASAEGDYLNCPLDEAQYARFYEELTAASQVPLHDADEPRFFEGCLPIEVMAARGVDTLRYGPMKPVGLRDPRTGRRPYAVVQLRQDTLAGDHYSMVGFQTRLKWGEQARVFRLIPGLGEAEFVRFGMIHRNTYINAPRVLLPTWQTRLRPDVLIAGQVSGVEGYVESAASGLLAGLSAVALVSGREPVPPPRTTALGALAFYVSRADPRGYQPANITFGIMAPIDETRRGGTAEAAQRARTAGMTRRRARRLDRSRAVAARALKDLAVWRATSTLFQEARG